MKLKDSKWLYENINNDKLIILDASLLPIGYKENEKKLIIPGARRFDLDTDFSDLDDSLPHTFPKTQDFIQSLQNIGICNDSIIVIYDDYGIYSSPRAYLMLKQMGFEEVFILDKGLFGWTENGFALEEPKKTNYKKGNFTCKKQNELFCNSDEVIKNYQNPDYKIIDARSNARFLGLEEEPREGLKKGHIPNSINIPYTQITQNYTFKSDEELSKIFQDISKNKHLIFYCGSGVSSCLCAVAALKIGYKNIKIYDASWSEWANESLNFPIEK